MRVGIGAPAILSMLFTLMMLESDVKVYLCMIAYLPLCIVNYMYLLQWTSLRSMLQATVPMVMFVWWEAPPSMKVEWRCASMTSGGLCVMTSGTVMMLL